MKYSMVATWKMSYDGVKEALELLKMGCLATDMVVYAINEVEKNRNYHSVGFGGLPNEEGVVQCDAGYMDGYTLQVGAVCAIENVVNAVNVARRASYGRFNNVLVGEGANQFAKENKFIEENLLTDEAYQMYLKRKDEDCELKSYDGHDTVGMIALDDCGSMCAATSTSGLFMKKKGRVGDSPLVGSGFYCDDEIGGAVATGVGEEIMRGCLSYEAVRRMKDGMDVYDAAYTTVKEWRDKMIAKKGYCDAISLLCMDNEGRIGVGTTVKFAYVYGNENEGCKIMIAEPSDGGFDCLRIRKYNPNIDEID